MVEKTWLPVILAFLGELSNGKCGLHYKNGILLHKHFSNRDHFTQLTVSHKMFPVICQSLFTGPLCFLENVSFLRHYVHNTVNTVNLHFLLFIPCWRGFSNFLSVSNRFQLWKSSMLSCACGFLFEREGLNSNGISSTYVSSLESQV